MGKRNAASALKVSHVAQVLIETAFLKHRSLQRHTFESLVDKLENAHFDTRPVLYFPGMNAQLIIRANLIIPTLQFFGKGQPLIHNKDGLQSMLIAGHILLSDRQLQIAEGTVPKALLMRMSAKVNEKPGGVRLGEICSLHPDIDHLPINWPATMANPDHRQSSPNILFVVHRFDFTAITQSWTKLRRRIEMELAKDSPQLKLTRRRTAK